MANNGGNGVNESIVAANQAPPGTAAEQPEWDGEHLQEAKKTLKEMYIQVCNLFNCFKLRLM